MTLKRKKTKTKKTLRKTKTKTTLKRRGRRH